MPYYTSLGQIPTKRHIQFRRPDGVLYSEEVFGTQGFDGPTSTMYHIHPPTQVSGWKHEYSTIQTFVETDVMRMRHLKSLDMKPQGDPITGRTVLFGNADCEMGVCVPDQEMEYHFKNGQGDECLFIHDGTGTLYTMFGTLQFKKFDFIVIPKGTIYRMQFDPPKLDPLKLDPQKSSPQKSGPVKSDSQNLGQCEGESKSSTPANRFMFIETMNASHILPPKRYLCEKTSQFLEHAPYCERDLRIPQLPLSYEEMGDFEVRIKALNSVHSYVYPYHPLDIVGWDGCYYPYCFNAMDFSPIVAKHHMPPPTHQVFAAGNFVICAFCPRMLDFHPEAIKVPYNHSNVDSDEVMYYCDDKYTARTGIGEGSMTMHPQGIPHGPHPGTIEATLDKTFTDELVVMCDTFRPLFPTKAAMSIDDEAYPKSWEDWKPIPLGD